MTAVELDSERARIRAAFVNTGRHSFGEADALLDASTLSLSLSDEAAATAVGQAAFFTAIVTAARSFGEVRANGRLDRPLLLPLQGVTGSVTLAQAATALGATLKTEPSKRHLVIGPAAELPDGSLHAFWNGWIAGVAPARAGVTVGRSDCVLAGVAAGALAVGQAFLLEQGDLRAGRARQEISLWSPDALEAGPEQRACSLPLHLWVVGLGNLGQAFLWSLGMLPYPEPGKVLIFLQDDDTVIRENWGTSILVARGRYGLLKTRLAEEWAEKRGFGVRRIDRRLDEHLRRTDLEPGLALAGLDGMPPRRLLGEPGFEFIIDAGLGASAEDYHKLRINAFEANTSPRVHFQDVEDQLPAAVEQLMQLPAYRELEAATGDHCGTALLAERTVAVPFVSAFAGAAAIAQAVRLASGGAPQFSIVGSISDVRGIRATPGQAPARLTIPTAPLAG